MRDPQKPTVVASLEDDSGDRCVDIVRHADGAFTFHECRLDPEDSHGWRRLSEAPGQRFPTEAAAYQAATRAVPWLLA